MELAEQLKAVIAKEAKKKTLTDKELLKFSLDSKRYEVLSKELKRLKADLDARESDFIVRFKAGAKVASKIFRVAVGVSKKRNVSWKDQIIKLFNSIGKDGVAETDRILSETKQDETEYITLTEKE